MNFKNLFSAVGFTAISLFSTAQTTITNAGFESWTGSGQTVKPVQWHTTKSDMAGNSLATGGAPQTIWDSTAAPHGGSHCVYLKSGSAFSTTVNGSVVTGQIVAPTLTATDGYVTSNNSSVGSGYGMTFTGRPDSLVFWIRYAPSGSNDYGTVEARTHNGTAYAPDNCYGGTNTTVVARALYATTHAAITSWTRVSVPFVYDGSYGTNNPAYILISTSASAPTSTGYATSGSQMWLDDFEAVYRPRVTNVASISPTAYNVTNSTGTAITVPFTFTGTNVAGATLTAQLSNASGSFASPVSLGTVTDNFTRTTTGTAPVYSGTIAGTIPANTATGTYKVRIISNQQSWFSDTATITVNLTNCGNTVSPSNQQTLITNQAGNALSVTESFTATSHAWYYGTSVGSYPNSLSNTSSTYTPQFASAGTYYVVCQSTGGSCSTVTSSPVTIIVSNPAATITTEDVSPLSYDISASANTQISVPFSTTASSFSAGNIFTVEISDQAGSFAVPSQTYQVTSTTVAPIAFQLSNTLAYGTQYLVRVNSSNPAIVGTPNATPFTVNPFTVSITPNAQQNLAVGQAGTTLNAVESQTATRQWKWSTDGTAYNNLSGQTGTSYTPQFTTAGTRYIEVCSVNQLASDTVCSNAVVIVTGGSTGINDIANANIKIYQAGNDLIIDADNSVEQNNHFALYTIVGQEVISAAIKEGKTTLNVANLAAGVYAFRLGEYSGKIVLK